MLASIGDCALAIRDKVLSTPPTMCKSRCAPMDHLRPPIRPNNVAPQRLVRAHIEPYGAECGLRFVGVDVVLRQMR